MTDQKGSRGIHPAAGKQRTHCRFFDPDIDDTKLLWAKDYANGTMYLSGTGEDQINTFSFRKTDFYAYSCL